MPKSTLSLSISALLVAHATLHADTPQLRRALIQAIKGGSEAQVLECIKAGADVKALLPDGSATPLMVVRVVETMSAEQKESMALLLLHAGADPTIQNSTGMDALLLEAASGSAKTCKAYCEHGCSPVRIQGAAGSALHMAASFRRADCLNAMLPFVPAGAIDTPSGEPSAGWTALHEAVAGGNTGGDSRCVKLLLGKGANPNRQDSKGLTPFWLAAADGRADLVDLLLHWGAKIDLSTTSGVTPLSIAAHEGRTEVVKLLIAHHAKVDIQSDSGYTALMSASGQGQAETVRLLLSVGARSDFRSKKGLTALDIAQQKHFDVIATLLRQGVSK